MRTAGATAAGAAIDGAALRTRSRLSILREGAWVTTGQAVGGVGSIVGVRILTHALDPVAYGELALGMTAATLALQVFLAPLTTSTLRFFSAAQEADDVRGFLAAVRFLLGAATAIIFATMVIALALTAVFSGWRWFALIIASFCYAMLSGTNSVLDGMQNAARQRLIVAWHDGIAPWLRFGAAVAFIALLSRATSGTAMLGYAVGSFAVLVSQFLFFRARIGSAVHHPRNEPDRQYWVRSMVGYGWPFALWGVFTWGQLASDRWALGAFLSTREVGLYASVFQLGFYPILMLSQALTQFAAPVLFERAGDATDLNRLRASLRRNKQFILIVLVSTVVAVAGAAVLHNVIARLLLAPEYRSASHFLPWMVLSAGLFATGQVAALSFMTANRSTLLTVPKTVTALVAVGLNFAGAFFFGVTGVVGAGVAAGGIYCAWLIARSRALVLTTG